MTTSPYIEPPTIPAGQTVAEYRVARGARRKASRLAKRRQQSRIARTVVSGVVVLSAQLAAHEVRRPPTLVLRAPTNNVRPQERGEEAAKR
jgi:hypothetical protein